MTPLEPQEWITTRLIWRK